MNAAERIRTFDNGMREGLIINFASHVKLRLTATAMNAALFAIIGIFFGARPSVSMQPGIPTRRGVRGTPDTLIAAKLSVHVIPTSYASGVGSQGKYPQTISLKIPATLKDSVSAYGAAGRIWLAPRGWDGMAAQGADGSTGVKLRPALVHSRVGPYVIYSDDGGCAGCAITDAARYFPDAKAKSREFGFDSEKTYFPHIAGVISGNFRQPISRGSRLPARRADRVPDAAAG